MSVPRVSPAGFRDFRSAVEALTAKVSNQVLWAPLRHTDQRILYEVISQFAEIGFVVRALPIIASDWKNFCERAGYRDFHSGYAGGNFAEKSLEHFVAATLLELSAEDTLVDIALEESPFGPIINRTTRARVSTQNWSRSPCLGIGGGSCGLMLPDNSVSKVSLLSVLEHCEGDGDIRLFQRMAHTLRPKGRVVVAPLYLFIEDVILTDPMCSADQAVSFDAGARLYCIQGWGHRHARFYTPRTLYQRILQFSDGWRWTIYHVLGTEQVGSDAYLRFVLLAERD